MYFITSGTKGMAIAIENRVMSVCAVMKSSLRIMRNQGEWRDGDSITP